MAEKHKFLKNYLLDEFIKKVGFFHHSLLNAPTPQEYRPCFCIVLSNCPLFYGLIVTPCPFPFLDSSVSPKEAPFVIVCSNPCIP